MTINVDVPATHPSYKDHFPEVTIVPGVVVLEQVISACEAQGLPTRHIKSCKFVRRASPGASLALVITNQSDKEFSVTLADEDAVFLRATFLYQ